MNSIKGHAYAKGYETGRMAVVFGDFDKSMDDDSIMSSAFKAEMRARKLLGIRFARERDWDLYDEGVADGVLDGIGLIHRRRR